MSAKKVIVIFGATGGQGGSVVRSILGDPKAAAKFQIRAVTRDVTKPAAKDLESKGCEVVTADMNDKASLTKALTGAYGVFAVTNYWEKLDDKLEIAQGKSIADVSKEVGIKHLVWSSLKNITKLTNGKLTKVAHFDSKAKVEDYIKEQGIPYTAFMPGMFMSNFPGSSILLNPQTGKYTLALPIQTTVPMPLLATKEDTGKFVKAIFLKPEQTLGKEIYGATDYYSPAEIISTFTEVKPTDAAGAVAIQIPGDVYKGFLAQAGLPEFVQEELLENFLLNEEVGYYGGASLKESQAILDEPLTTFKQFCIDSKEVADLK